MNIELIKLLLTERNVGHLPIDSVQFNLQQEEVKMFFVSHRVPYRVHDNAPVSSWYLSANGICQELNERVGERGLTEYHEVLDLIREEYTDEEIRDLRLFVEVVPE